MQQNPDEYDARLCWFPEDIDFRPGLVMDVVMRRFLETQAQEVSYPRPDDIITFWTKEFLQHSGVLLERKDNEDESLFFQQLGYGEEFLVTPVKDYADYWDITHHRTFRLKEKH